MWMRWWGGLLSLVAVSVFGEDAVETCGVGGRSAERAGGIGNGLPRAIGLRRVLELAEGPSEPELVGEFFQLRRAARSAMDHSQTTSAPVRMLAPSGLKRL